MMASPFGQVGVKIVRPKDVARWLSGCFIAAISAPLPVTAKLHIRSGLSQDLPPVWERETPYGPVKFYCPSLQTYRRALNVMRKEPGTNDWLESMAAGEVLWDIGANVGAYTILGAAKGLRVCAFEPEAGNLAVLQRNLDLNGFHDRVTALNVAVSDKTEMVRFALASDVVGSAKHQIANDGRCVMAVAARDAEALFGLPRPNHIKIDVDGAELAVMRGLDLKDAGLRSVLIELRANGVGSEIVSIFSAAGFRPTDDLDLIDKNRGRATNFVFRRA